MLLAFVQSLTTVQICALIGLLYFLNRFQQPIAAFINRIRQVKFAGADLQAQGLNEKDGAEAFGLGTVDAGPSTLKSSPRSEDLAPTSDREQLALTEISKMGWQGDLDFARSSPAQTVVEYRRMVTRFVFEHVTNRIFGTQIDLLRFLGTRKEATAREVDLLPFYIAHLDRISGLNPSDPKPSMREYMRFLENNKLVETTPEGISARYKLTDSGRQFLSYIFDNYAWMVGTKPL